VSWAGGVVEQKRGHDQIKPLAPVELFDVAEDLLDA
jgi:hypothetical protein